MMPSLGTIDTDGKITTATCLTALHPENHESFGTRKIKKNKIKK